MLYRIPSSLNDILNDDYFGELIEAVKNIETGILQVKLLSMMRERADLTRKLEIKRILLQKITYLSRKIAAGARGLRKTVVANYRPGLDEIDVDRTLEAQLGHPTLEYENIFCHEKVKQKSACALLLDVSNSMHREKIPVASIATGVFASKLKNDFHGVITFARDTEIIKHMNEPNDVELLLNRMLDINSGGATNIRKALLAGLDLLKESKTMVRTAILVTDGWATVGGDPVEIASKYDRLHVLGISFGFGGCDPAANTLMAKKGNGRYMYVRAFDDLPATISKILANRK